MIPMLRSLTRSTLALTAVAGIGCNGAPAPASPTQSVAPQSSAARMTGPRIVGTVVWAPETTKKGAGVVYLEDAPRQPGAAMTAEIDIKNKEFTPFIGVTTTGSTVTFGNRDSVTHHMFSPDIPGWDTGYLQKNDTVSRKFDGPGAYALLCNIHPEMIGYLLVIPSTYFGRVGADGKYVIGDVPPGTYKATAWSPRMTSATQSVTVGASGAVTANFELHPAGGPT